MSKNLHYLVIWLTDKDMNTREETPVDLEVSHPETDDAGTRYEAIVKAIAENYEINQSRVSIVNICKL